MILPSSILAEPTLAIQIGGSSLVDLEYGIRTQRILLAMYASAQTHQRITFGENETEPEFRFL